MFHRQYMHAMLMDSAVAEPEKPGVPAKLLVNHKVTITKNNAAGYESKKLIVFSALDLTSELERLPLRMAILQFTTLLLELTVLDPRFVHSSASKLREEQPMPVVFMRM